MGDVTERRELPATTEQVWQALTRPRSLEQWFWPPHFATTAEIELSPGGRYRIASPVAGMAVSGQYVQVQSPDLISFSWQWDGEDTESVVTIGLSGTGASTELSLAHVGLAESEVANHVQGWTDCLDRLPAWLAGH
jgi:uncharacterized protein YndB with AHSA1/START domain